MNYKSSKNLHWFLLIMVFIILLVLAFLSEGFYGGADNINHYFISRYSFRYPYLFLDTWGRPVFTIMSSPFSQFGFGGLKLFNVLLGCLSAFLAFLTARKIGIRQSWLAILFVIFTPMYFLMTLTGLTEIQFGFILILCISFLMKNTLLQLLLFHFFLFHVQRELFCFHFFLLPY
jgi:ABC-type cobalt transport system substrate-binding protein